MVIAIIYGIVGLVVIGCSIYLLIEKRAKMAGFVLIPTIISLLIFGAYADANHYWTIACDESTGCMNESGLFAVISYFFMMVAVIVLAFTLLKRRMS